MRSASARFCRACKTEKAAKRLCSTSRAPSRRYQQDRRQIIIIGTLNACASDNKNKTRRRARHEHYARAAHRLLVLPRAE